MINNFELIKNNMNYLNERSFYFIQIIKRKKENPDLKSDSMPIDSFYVYSKEQLDNLMPHIIEKCEEKKARAYIKMNCLDAQAVMLEEISILTQKLRNEDWKHINIINSACGSCGMQKGNEKLYLVDLDDITIGSDKFNEIVTFIDNLQPMKYTDETMSTLISKVKMAVPTKNGCHLLTTGFNMKDFSKAYPGIDIHGEGITLLYFPESCMAFYNQK